MVEAMAEEEVVVPADAIQLVPGNYNRRPGRPVTDDPQRKRIVRFPDDLWDAINRHCKALGVVRSQWLREAAQEKLERESK